MSIVLTAPEALWLLVAVPLIWLGLRFGRTNYSLRQRLCQAAVRSALVIALALALARPVTSWGTAGVAVVYLVDVSHSVSSEALRAAASKIDSLGAEARPARSRILVFGATTAVIPDTTALRALADASANPTDPVLRDDTDVAQGLDRARAELPWGYRPHIVLFSDGRPSSGDLLDAAAALSADGIPVSVEPLEPRHLGDAWIDAIELPERVPAGAAVPVRVVLGSQRAGPITVELRDGGTLRATTSHTLAPGLTSVTLEPTFPVAGSRALEARLVATADPLAANNTLVVEAVVSPQSRVLYVEGASDSSAYLTKALGDAGLSVTVETPDELPQAARDLDPWDLLILSDVPRGAIPDETMGAVSRWVEHEGGGVLFAGGDAVFGEAADGSPVGYRHTELERILPVTIERKDEPEVALVIVLDKSWSMEGAVMELCKAAAIAAVDVMAEHQLIGIVSFDSEFKWDVPVRKLGTDRQTMRDTIAGIQASGATRIFPALEQSYLALKDLTARAKHVILLTDGRSYDADYETLVRKMIASRITVSSVGVGPAADKELMTRIAAWGMGRSYIVNDARAVQQIFVREAKDAAAPAFDEAIDIAPVVKTRAFLEPVNLGDMPPLGGRTGMAVKDEATEILATADGSPLFAFWAAGAGRTAAFASDVKDRWANRWIGWRGYGPFFAATAHALVRQRAPRLDLSVASADVHQGRRRVTAQVEVRDAHGDYRNLVEPVLRVAASGGSTGEVPMQQVAPGRYEATVTAGARETLTLTATTPDEPPSAGRLVIPDANAEYRLRPTDEALLGTIASTTGGVVRPTGRDLDRAGATMAATRELWPWPVGLALLLWFGDIALRRFRFGPMNG